jgi:beta-galactosidase
MNISFGWNARSLLAALVLCLAAPVRAAEPYVWLEGEQPTRATAPWKSATAGHKEYLSGEKWLQIAISAKEAEKLPKDGATLEYDFTIEKAGDYEVWDRVGFESLRGPFEWRIDTGAWQKPAARWPTDLMEVDFWADVAWLSLGKATLTAGKHTLHIRPQMRFKEEKKNINGKEEIVHTPEGLHYVSDCICFQLGSFRPHGKHKPDADWQTADDKKAAAHVFKLPEGNGPERQSLSLSGLWQVGRYDENGIVDRDGPTKELPSRDHIYWSSITVPGDKFKVKPELAFAHRIIYRTRVQVPAGTAGRSFVLHFPSLNMIASVHVNGRFCGWTKAMFAPWDCDVTSAIKPGAENEICVVIKDAYYATNPKRTGQDLRASFFTPSSWQGQNWINQNYDFPVGSGDYSSKAGILREPSLVVAGGVYPADVFVQPSVKKKQLGLEVTLLNTGATARKAKLLFKAVPLGGGAEKVFAPEEVEIPAGQEHVVKLTRPWDDPKLWWPDDPQQYHLVTEVTVDGKVVDVLKTKFGFREWGWDKAHFTLNGVPWYFRGDTSGFDGNMGPEKTIEYWRKCGINCFRFWGDHFDTLTREETLDLMDRSGVCVRLSGILDGQGANYLHGLVETVTIDGKPVTRGQRALFDNWIVQMKARVRAERNHPSILIWSLENEITFINSRNLGISQYVEPEIERGAKEIMAFDPTRPVMVDGGNALVDKSLPVNGVHYLETYWRDYPDEAYTLEHAYVAHEKPVLPGWGKNHWQLMPDRPTFMGESFFLRGNKPGEFAQFGGEGCFAGWSEHTRRGAGLFAKMLAEGYRWHGVAGYTFWMGEGDAGGLHLNSWQPVCVLCRQWNWTFAGGKEVKRTLKVFNDTHLTDPIEASWELLVGGKPVASGKETFKLAAGEHREYEVAFTPPAVKERTAAQFVLTCRRGGKEVFREVMDVAVIDPNAGPLPKLTKDELVVIDPDGAVKARLQARGVAFTEAKIAADVPAKAKVVVIGKNALSPRDATDPRWLSLAGGGTRVLVLDQDNPLRHLAVPADLASTNFVGRVAFSENLNHPVFAGLDQPDFFTWSKDHIVYRNVYRKATRGALSLAHCDEQLGYSALAECRVNDGLLLLCQMVVGEKLGSDPVAQRLFDNMLAYAATYVPVRRQTAVVLDPQSPAAKLLEESGLKYDRAADVLDAVASGKHQVVVFDATPANLKKLAGAPEKVKAFTEKGGWLMAWGVTPEGLADFNKLVGVEHVLRPFELERVTLPAVRDPLLAGLTGRDVAMESAETIFPWAGDKYMVDDEFTWIVDFDDIAAFCAFPGAKAGDHKAARDAAANWSRNVVKGFTSHDAWKLIHYMPTAAPRLTLTLPREEEITDLSIILNTHYAKATKVNLYYDDSKEPVVLSTKPTEERQDFALKPRKARKLTVELAGFDDPTKPTTGIENLQLRVRRSDDWRKRVKPLLNIGGLVKYPMGEGGIVLNQLRIPAAEGVPANAEKKRAIVTALLRNLGAVFAGGKVLTLGDLSFRPISIGESCNQFLSKDRGWLDGGRDLTHLPTGRNTFAGVTYDLVDFKTSPVPSCVMLAGPGAKGKLAKSVTVKVGGKADSLFFLHTLNKVRDWQPPQQGSKEPPASFRYVVRYTDGKTAEVPVRLGEGVDHWLSKSPVGLKNAAVAWAAPFPNDKSGEQAVVYQMQWQNPRPDVEIASVELTYDAKTGDHYGAPVLLGLTAARERR